MDNQSVFEAYLRKRNRKGAFRWVMERLAWNPDSTELRGMGAFAFLLLGDGNEARVMAKEVLLIDPDQQWALAVLLAASYRESVAEEPMLFRNGNFKLDPQWIKRFEKLGMETESRKLIYCLSRFGTPAQRAFLSEECLVDADTKGWTLQESPQRKSQTQLQLPLNQ